MHNLTDFDKQIPPEKYAIVFFGGKSCRNCTDAETVIEEISEETSVKCFFVEAPDNLDLAWRFSVSILPTVIVFQEGKILDIIPFKNDKERYLLRIPPDVILKDSQESQG